MADEKVYDNFYEYQKIRRGVESGKLPILANPAVPTPPQIQPAARPGDALLSKLLKEAGSGAISGATYIPWAAAKGLDIAQRPIRSMTHPKYPSPDIAPMIASIEEKYREKAGLPKESPPLFSKLGAANLAGNIGVFSLPGLGRRLLSKAAPKVAESIAKPVAEAIKPKMKMPLETAKKGLETVQGELFPQAKTAPEVKLEPIDEFKSYLGTVENVVPEVKMALSNAYAASGMEGVYNVASDLAKQGKLFVK